MSENALWNTVRNNMKKYWIPQRIENLAEAGIPDVYYTMKLDGSGGWIELKHVPSWPKRETTALKIKHFTKEQMAWIRKHGRAGARVFVLLQVERDYFLLKWDEALNIGKWKKSEYLKISKFRRWKNRIDYKEFRFIIRTW